MAYKSFHISKPLLAHHYDIEASDGVHLTARMPKDCGSKDGQEPDLKITAGRENGAEGGGAVINSVYFPTDKEHVFEIDPDGDGKGKAGGGGRIKMDARKAWRHRYTYTGPDGRGMIWKRTWSHAVEGHTPGLSHRNYKLMRVEHGEGEGDGEGDEDADGSRILAVFTARLGVSSVGTLQLNDDERGWGQRGEELVLLTLLAIYETVRRSDGAALGEAGDAAGTAVDAVAG
ncbi:hypothetical protein N3K66_004408 [Trichothecium roseum]|uniref:Uncharacterized protein n=1 Tax=Trichothecium roseum TaxID=47278 RepID=A0ACC0V1X4_9HYPO|nr:hypothetical protein N3K66_004408 [Trichothecium roseum]